MEEWLKTCSLSETDFNICSSFNCSYFNWMYMECSSDFASFQLQWLKYLSFSILFVIFTCGIHMLKKKKKKNLFPDTARFAVGLLPRASPAVISTTIFNTAQSDSYCILSRCIKTCTDHQALIMNPDLGDHKKQRLSPDCWARESPPRNTMKN